MTAIPYELTEFARNVLTRKYIIFEETLKMPTTIAISSERLVHCRFEGQPFYNRYIDSSENYLGMKIIIDNSLTSDEFKLV